MITKYIIVLHDMPQLIKVDIHLFIKNGISTSCVHNDLCSTNLLLYAWMVLLKSAFWSFAWNSVKMTLTGCLQIEHVIRPFMRLIMSVIQVAQKSCPHVNSTLSRISSNHIAHSSLLNTRPLLRSLINCCWGSSCSVLNIIVQQCQLLYL